MAGHGAQFEAILCRLHFIARGPLHFPAGMPANLVRGILGAALYGSPAYGRIFAPRTETGPSGLKDVPRPFVLRAGHLDNCRLQAGQPFHIDVHIFIPEEAAAKEIHGAFARWACAELLRAELSRISVSLHAPATPVRNLRVRFLSPTELKSGAQIAARPEFAVLFARARDRVSTLRAAYGPGPLEIDFAGMARRAAQVRLASCQLRHVCVERRSRTTGRRHPLGGFTGDAVYEGELGEFLPVLRAAEWTGVGRQTVWGHGAICVEV